MDRCKRFLYVLLISFGIGIIIGSLFQSSYFDELKNINDNFFGNIKNYPVFMDGQDNMFLLFKVIVRRSIPFFLLWVLAGTRFEIPYVMYFVISRGFYAGFYSCFMFMCYKLAACRLIPGMCFPQMIIYILVYTLTIIYNTEGFNKRKRLAVSVLAFLLLAGCIMETYVSPKIMMWAV